MKITRRKLAAALTASGPLAAIALAQTATENRRATVEEDLQSARDNIRNNSEQLRRAKLDIATEPAFHFKA